MQGNVYFVEIVILDIRPNISFLEIPSFSHICLLMYFHIFADDDGGDGGGSDGGAVCWFDAIYLRPNIRFSLGAW